MHLVYDHLLGWGVVGWPPQQQVVIGNENSRTLQTVSGPPERAPIASHFAVLSPALFCIAAGETAEAAIKRCAPPTPQNA